MSPNWLHAGIPTLPHEAPTGLLGGAQYPSPFPAGECGRAEPATATQSARPGTPATGAGRVRFEPRAQPER